MEGNLMRTNINTIGIMFELGDRFPTLGELDQSNWINLHSYGNELTDTGLAKWIAIAYDPRSLMYADQSDEAMDTTNWHAIVNELLAWIEGIEGLPEVRINYNRSVSRTAKLGSPNVSLLDGIDRALDVGIAVIYGYSGSAIIIDPNRGWMVDYPNPVDIAYDLVRCLSDYPLLDDEAYSELEYESWLEYVPMAWQDEIRDSDLTDDEKDELGEIDDLDTVLGNVCQHLHYYDGFSGEYGPSLLDIFSEQVAIWEHAVKHENHMQLDLGQ